MKINKLFHVYLKLLKNLLPTRYPDCCCQSTTVFTFWALGPLTGMEENTVTSFCWPLRVQSFQIRTFPSPSHTQEICQPTLLFLDVHVKRGQNFTRGNKKQTIIKFVQKTELRNPVIRKFLIVETVKKGGFLIVPYPEQNINHLSKISKMIIQNFKRK